LGDVTKTLLSTNCVLSSAGTKTVSIPTTLNKKYEVRGYITKAGITYFLTSLIITNSDDKLADKDGLFWGFVLFMTITLIGYFSLEIALIMSGLGIIILGVFQIIPMMYSAGLIAVALIVTYLVNKTKKVP
jgi:hypothetical protein